jgi:hypothetical protein
MRYSIEQTVDGDYMILVDGVQWGQGPRDMSGASSQTWPTEKEAWLAIDAWQHGDSREDAMRYADPTNATNVQR